MWLLLAASGACAGAAPYGEAFARSNASWSDAGPALAPEPGSESIVSADYEVLLEELEGQGGPYADALAEPLASLAAQQVASGDFDAAQQLYRRALHVVRINDGLYSERQIPVLRGLLQTYRAAGDYLALDDRYDYYFRLYGAGQPPHTEVRLRAALEYLRWQREALRRKVGSGEMERLLDLYELNEELLEAVQKDRSVPYTWRRELVMSQLRNLYLLRDRVQPRQQTSNRNTASPFPASSPLDISVHEQKLDNLQRGAGSEGERLLQGLLPAAREQTRVEEAAIYLALADWQTWLGDRGAGANYREVVRALNDAGEQVLLSQWLGEPVELPDNGAFWQPPGGEEEARVTLRFDVSARGRVTGIDTIAIHSGDEGDVSQLRRRLAKTRFRPRWVQGEAQQVTGLERDYRLYPR